MKVCIIRNSEAESNASIIRILDALIEARIDVVILSRTRETRNNQERILEKDFYYKGKLVKNYEIQLSSQRGGGIKNLNNLFQYMKIVYKWLKRNNSKFDYIHAIDLDSGFPSQLISKKHNKKLIYHIADFYVDSRGGIPNNFKKYIKNMEFKVINNAELTIICTEERRKQILGSAPKRLAVIHNTPVDPLKKYNLKSNFNVEKFGSLNPLKIAYVGGLTETRFINELLQVVSETDSVSLDIAGYGPLSEKVEMYAKNNSNINYYGSVSYSESQEINSRADLLVAMYNPSLKNNRFSAPNKAYEAMSFGIPIIVAKETSVDKLVMDEKIGYVSEYNIEEFRKILKGVLEESIEYQRLSSNSAATYDKYSWKTMKRKLIVEYELLIREGKSEK